MKCRESTLYRAEGTNNTNLRIFRYFYLYFFSTVREIMNQIALIYYLEYLNTEKIVFFRAKIKKQF